MSKSRRKSRRKDAATKHQTGYVLIVDDDADFLSTMEAFLTATGYRTVAVPAADLAVRQIMERQPAVLLLDIAMPGLTGIDALPVIRVLAPDTAVIMVSGVADVEIGRRALACGAFDYVAKPVDFNYLARSIEIAATGRGKR
jgi:DNA-binding NtrC family response regulator